MSVTAALDKAGRIVLPKILRDKLRLAPGDVLDITVQGEELTLRPRRVNPPLQRERGIWVFRTGEPLSAAEMRETQRILRERRDRRNTGESE
jgi:AbrB family looped-hinge helix DNA binding protein